MDADKILVVDDEGLARWSLRQKCEEWGSSVLEAEAGEPALKLRMAGSVTHIRRSPASKASLWAQINHAVAN